MPRRSKTFVNVPGVNLNISEIREDAQGILWLATDDGITRYDGQGFRVFHDPVAQKGDDYFQAVPSADGKVWLRSSLGRSMSYIDTRQQRIVRVPDSTRVVRDYLQKRGMSYIFIDPRGTLWIGLWDNGMLRVDPKTLAAEHVFKEPTTVAGIAETADGMLWLATSRGLYAYNPATKRTKAYRYDPQNTNSPGSDQLATIKVRQNGQLFLGLSCEVDLFDPATETFRRMPLHKHNNHARAALFSTGDHADDYFVTYYAAYRYSDRSGLQRLEFDTPGETYWSAYVDRRNRLWLGGNHALSLYQQNPLRRLPPISLLDVKINGARLTASTAKHPFVRDSLGQLSLAMLEDETVSIRYATSLEPRINRSRTRLINYDAHWIPWVETSTTLTYQPPPGRYTLLISRSRDNGTWEPEIKVMHLTVKPLFYKTWWLRGLAILLVVGGGYFLIRTYLRRQRMQQELALEKLEAGNLRRLDELKSQFFTNVTHEFRTPLTLILHAAEQLADRSMDAWGQERLTTIQRNADQLTRLIVEMLDISRMDAHKLEIHTQLGDPVSFVSEHARAFVELAAKKSIGLTVTTSPESPLNETYLFDDDKLSKIVYNLVSNALKFTPEGGSVSVYCGLTEAHHLMLTVQDTGIGIAPDQLPRIFERFYQADSSTTRRYEGSGIGLAYVKELTELLGGRVAAESVPGEGSTFIVTIPVEKVLTAPADPVSRPSPTRQPLPPAPLRSQEPATANQLMVLVVEDNEELRTYIAGQLRQTYQVVEAVDGRAGIEQALTTVPDLIVSDVMMPYVDGYELVSTLKNDERTSHVPIILLTAKSSFDSRMYGLGVGADDYVAKPFQFAELNARIRNFIFTRQRWQQYLANAQTSAPKNSPPADPLVNRLPDKEKQFLERLRQLILAHLTDEVVDVDWLVAQSRMSRTQLHRKLTALTNLSTTGFIHRVRLEKARELMQAEHLTVAEVSYRVGYSSSSYFSKVFSEHFGYPPNTLKV